MAEIQLCNKIFIRAQEQWLNDCLLRDGFIGLNDIVSDLGFPRKEEYAPIVITEPFKIDYNDGIVRINIAQFE